MKRLSVVLFTNLFLIAFASLSQAASPTLTIYAYDSFVAKGGLGPSIREGFETRCGCRLDLIGVGDGGQLLNRLELDHARGRSRAHVVVGLDHSTWGQAKRLLSDWGDWRPQGFADVAPEAKSEPGFLPFDYGAFSFIVDQQTAKEVGLVIGATLRLEDLLRQEFRRKLILEDPRTSTPGLALLAFTQALLGEKAWVFWGSLKTQWLTLAQGWDAAYGIFLKGEAPLVWSYVTSEAYHREHGDTSRYRAVLFEEGQPLQIEGAAIPAQVAGEDLRRARLFLDYLLTKEVQEQIPLKNWMWPARKGIQLPKSFSSLPKPKRLVPLQLSAESHRSLLSQWQEAVRTGSK